MPTKETMENIEITLERIENTLNTLERIPNVNLNGTTKQQQVIILSTVATASLTTGVMLTAGVVKVVRRFREKKQARLSSIPPLEGTVITSPN